MKGVALVFTFVFVLCGCGREQNDTFVFAASSMTDVVSAWSSQFETRTHQSVKPNFAGSHVLRAQIEGGAPADLFMSANRHHIEELDRAGLVKESFTFATTDFVLVVPENVSEIVEFRELANAQRVIVATEHVPLGSYTNLVLDRCGKLLGGAWRDQVNSRVVSKEANARQVRVKVALGEADAAILYRPDADFQGLRVVEIPSECQVEATYGIALLSSKRSFYDFVKNEGSDQLEAFGYEVSER